MSNNKDFKVKNGIQPTVYHEGLGTVVSGSVGYNLAGASYDSVSFNGVVSTRDCVFKPDGTKMFTVSSNDDLMHEYDLSTAWDVSTATQNVSSDLDVSTQGATSLFSLAFKSDGTKCYACDNGTSSIYQYTLSTAWDLSTASFDSSLSVNSNGRYPHGFVLKTDGTSFYVLGTNVGSVYQYDMSTAYDISTASYASKSLTLTTAYEDIEISSDGTTLYALLSGGVDTVNQYTLSTAWDISTATDDSISFYIGGQELAPEGVTVVNSGKSMYITGTSTTYQYSTALNTATLDLSTGSVFDYTPTSDVQVTLSNPAASGTVSGATLLLEGAEATGVANTFSTTLYTGNGGTQTITNGIDLAGDGGLVWTKDRDTAVYHALVDTERGGQNMLVSSETLAQTDRGSDFITSFNSNGYSIGADGLLNDTYNYVSWTFKKQSSFFDVVTYTGDGVAGRSISHNLGSVPGVILVKKLNAAASWMVYHVGLDPTSPENYFLELDNTNPRDTGGGIWNDTAPTNTVFTVSSATQVNQNNATYVAYLFAHDTDASSLIQCGSYTGNGSNTGPVINLGWEPQWLMFKNASASVRETVACDWMIFDNVRGIEPSPSKKLEPNTNDVEQGLGIGLNVTSTGFQIDDFNRVLNFSGDTFIYIAIRAENIPTITYDPTLEWSGGTAPTAPANGETDVVTFNTRDGGSTYQGVLAIDGAK